METALLHGALAGALAGGVGAFVAAAADRGSRILRNDAWIARGQPAGKDVVWRPHWRGFGAVGAFGGAAAGALHVSLWISALAGAALPILIVVVAAGRVARARLG